MRAFAGLRVDTHASLEPAHSGTRPGERVDVMEQPIQWLAPY